MDNPKTPSEGNTPAPATTVAAADLDPDPDQASAAGAEQDAKVETAPKTTKVATLVFIDHTGNKFVFPLESCKTYRAFKNLVERTYARSSEKIKNDVQQGRFDLLSIENGVILPDVWDDVVRDSLPLERSGGLQWYSVRMSFWSDQAPEPLPMDDSFATPGRNVQGTDQRPREEFVIGNGSVQITIQKGAEVQISKEDEGARPRSRSRPQARERSSWSLDRSLSRRRSRSYTRRITSRRSNSANTRDSVWAARVREEELKTEELLKRREERRLREEILKREKELAAVLGDLSPSATPARGPIVEIRPSSVPPSISESSSSSVSEDDETLPEIPPPPPPPPRIPDVPMDKDGNWISYKFDTQRSADQEIQKAKAGGGDITDMIQESPLRVLKSLQNHSETKMTVQLHILPGPESSFSSPSISFRWYHLYGDELDFSQFKNTCLGLPNLSSRVRTLIFRTLGKVEVEKTGFLQGGGGRFIEPGTVLRGEESDRPNPKSVIFSCIPYFEVRPRWKATAGKTDRLHHPRTLMEGLYPNESVHERDREQAYAKLRTGTQKSSKNIVHIPSLWLMNIGAHTVVSCGHRPLAKEFVKSIEIVQEDDKSLSISSASKTKDKPKGDLAGIRLKDWDGLVRIYTLDECATYFQVEQRLKELRFSSSQYKGNNEAVELACKTKDNLKKIAPRHWMTILKNRESIYIDICVLVGDNKTIGWTGEERDYLSLDNDALHSSIPPFFEWEQATKKSPSREIDALATQAEEINIADIPPGSKRCKLCLLRVEKAMVTETLNGYDCDVDEAFNTTDYYKSLPDETRFEQAKKTFDLLLEDVTNPGQDASHRDRTMHQIIVSKQTSKLVSEAARLLDIMHRTLKLFVSEVDDSEMLRKVWEAMMKVATIIGHVQKLGAWIPEPEEFTDPEWASPLSRTRMWFVRDPTSPLLAGEIEPEDQFTARIGKCKQCRRNHMYTSPVSAFDHLRKHDEAFDWHSVTGQRKLHSWIRNYDQGKMEEFNAACLTLISRATENANDLLVQVQELADGVKREDGTTLPIYTLPQELFKTFRRLLVYYLSVERALHFTYQASQSKDEDEILPPPSGPPSTNKRLAVIQRFCDNVKTSILAARKDLCSMARSNDTQDPSARLCLSAEYVSAWFMRRLIVKSLEDDSSMTAADLYHDYLQKLQFQVNHHPNKRLLRSINLLQDELRALELVNSWQAKLIFAYDRALDDKTYEKDNPSRRGNYPNERALLESVLQNLEYTSQDYAELSQRCGPLQESTKQSAEINEEDHGKAILIFTVVTIIFLPLSFVTSYLGMNTSDIRDMESKQTLFWEIAIPLTVVTMGSMLLIAYNGDTLRDGASTVYRRVSGKPEIRQKVHGISVAQRKQLLKQTPGSDTSTLGSDEAEFVPPYSSAWNTRFDLAPEDDLPIVYNSHDPNPFQPRMAQRIIRPTQRRAPFNVNARRRTGVPELSRPAAGLYNLYPRHGDNISIIDAGPPNFEHTRAGHTRIPRRYLNADFLARKDIPWDFDPADPEYFLVLRQLMPYEASEILADAGAPRGGRDNHGLRIGGSPSDESWPGAGARYPFGRPAVEYAWVTSKKKKAARAERRGYI